MRRHLRKPGLWIAVLLLLALWLLWPRPVASPPPLNDIPSTSQSASAPVPLAGPDAAPAARTGLPGFLPAEARRTIDLIQRGGPFPYRQDGQVFGNREGHLPSRPRGHYREYTVETPGLSHRGARRIVTGGRPADTWYYSDDHYDSFRAFRVPAREPVQ
jgi:guanyl-specific ribonuclease Sa